MGNATHVTVCPHTRTSNTHYPLAAEVRPIVIGQPEDVVIQWVTPVAIAADQLDVSILGAIANGGLATGNIGFAFRATRALIEPGWTDGAFYDGSTPNDYPTSRTRWLGGVNASQSVKENLIPRVG